MNEIDFVESFIGIYAKRDRNLDLDSFRAACQDDSELTMCGPNYALCFKQKGSLQDKAFQPTGTNFGTSAFFYGEMYNFNELCADCGIEQEDYHRHSFSELCCFLYRKYGLQFASKINGIFSIVLIGDNEEKLCLFADRFGSARPIYYHISDQIIFSNKLKLLLCLNDINKDIDKQAIALFLKYSYVPSPKTLIKGIQKLNPGEVLIYSKGLLTKSRYVSFEASQQTISSESEAIEIYSHTLESSVLARMQTNDNQRLGFFLSGGLDASANVAFAAKTGSKAFETFGVGFDDVNLDERPYAKIVAKHFGTRFNDYLFTGSEIEELPKIIWYLEEPFMENGLFLTYAAFKAAKDRADVIIAGDGADQLFGTGGFADGRPIALRYIFDKLNLRHITGKVWSHLLNPLFYKDNFLFQMKVMLQRALDFNDWFFWGFDDKELKELCNYPISKPNISPFSNNMGKAPIALSHYYQYALTHQDMEHYVCQNVLVKSFRMAELFGIRLRETYMDNNVIDCLASIKMSLKTKGGLAAFLKGRRITKYLHRLLMKEILPHQLLAKPKQGGFVPMTLLLENSQRRQAIYRYLLKSEFLENYMNMDYIKLLLKRYEDSIMKPVYWQAYRDSKVNQIMNLLILPLWYELVVCTPQTFPKDHSLSQYIGEG